MLDVDYRRCVPPYVRAAMDRLRDPQAVWDVFRDDETIFEMERLTALKRPALGAASAKLLALGNWVRGHDAKRTFGKVARCVMETRGYTVEMTGVPTPEDPLFRKGARYRPGRSRTSETETTTLTVPGIDAALAAKLRARATRNGRPIEAELRQIIAEAVAEDVVQPEPNLAEAIHRRFAALGGVEDLEPYPDVPVETPPSFDP